MEGHPRARQGLLPEEREVGEVTGLEGIGVGVPTVQHSELLVEQPDLESQVEGELHPLHVAFFDVQGRALLALEARFERGDLTPGSVAGDEDLGPREGVEVRLDGDLELAGEEVLGVRAALDDLAEQVSGDADLRIQRLQTEAPGLEHLRRVACFSIQFFRS